MLLWKVVIIILFWIAVFHLMLTLWNINRAHNTNSETVLSSGTTTTSDQLHLKINSTLTTLHQQLQTIKTKYKSSSFPSQQLRNNNNVIINYSSPVTTTNEHNQRAVQPFFSSPLTTTPILSTSNNIKKKKKALIFTMDSIESYEEHSLHGGAAGEILIRKCLEYALTHYFHMQVDTIRSDHEFEHTISSEVMATYDFIILDPWTWAAPGWVPKAVIKHHQDRIYLLDFFGSQQYKGSLQLTSLKSHVLTAFGSPWNSFLGFYLSKNSSSSSGSTDYVIDSNDKSKSSITNINNTDNQLKMKRRQQRQGIIWGKDIKHYQGKYELLKSAAEKVTLISTATIDKSDSDHQQQQHTSSSFTTIIHIEWRGHQTASSWQKLLTASRLLLGLGDPLLGPSAKDAISAGCVYINPRYKKIFRNIYYSQHPYAENQIGIPYVHSYDINDISQLHTCIDHALSVDLPAFTPTDFRTSEDDI